MATIKDWARMCEAKGTDCICCELAMQRCGMSHTLSRVGDIDRIDKAVDKWVKDHPEGVR